MHRFVRLKGKVTLLDALFPFFSAFLPFCTKLERGNVIPSLEERSNSLISLVNSKVSEVTSGR